MPNNHNQLKNLLKLEIKSQIKEFGPLSTLQGIVGGLLDKIATAHGKAVNMSYDKKIKAAKGEHAQAVAHVVKLAKTLEKKYGSWDKVPKGFKMTIDKKIPNIKNKLKNFA